MKSAAFILPLRGQGCLDCSVNLILFAPSANDLILSLRPKWCITLFPAPIWLPVVIIRYHGNGWNRSAIGAI